MPPGISGESEPLPTDKSSGKLSHRSSRTSYTQRSDVDVLCAVRRVQAGQQADQHDVAARVSEARSDEVRAGGLPQEKECAFRLCMYSVYLASFEF